MVTVCTTTAIEHGSPKHPFRLQVVSRVVRHALFMCQSHMYPGQVPVSVVCASMTGLLEKCLKKYEILYSWICFLGSMKHPIHISGRGLFLRSTTVGRNVEVKCTYCIAQCLCNVSYFGKHMRSCPRTHISLTEICYIIF